MDLLVTKAILMYLSAKEASQEGKHVGITTDADALETEFKGFGAASNVE